MYYRYKQLSQIVSGTLNSLGADCVLTYAKGDWDDTDCQSKLRSVCEGPAVCGNFS